MEAIVQGPVVKRRRLGGGGVQLSRTFAGPLGSTETRVMNVSREMRRKLLDRGEQRGYVRRKALRGGVSGALGGALAGASVPAIASLTPSGRALAIGAGVGAAAGGVYGALRGRHIARSRVAYAKGLLT